MFDLRNKVRSEPNTVMTMMRPTQTSLSSSYDTTAVTDLSQKKSKRSNEYDSTAVDDNNINDNGKVYTSNSNKFAFTIENLIKKRVESGEVSILKANESVSEKDP